MSKALVFEFRGDIAVNIVTTPPIVVAFHPQFALFPV